MSCEKENQYINLYFFKNGSCRKPEKIRRRKSEIEKLVSKKGKFCYYHDKIIYTICGEPVTTLSKFVNNSPFVLVESTDYFKLQRYSQIFNELMQETSNDQYQSRPIKKESNQRKCQSTPTIPTCSRKSSEQSVKFAPIAEEESSDDEFYRESFSNNKRKAPARKRNSKPLPKQQPARIKKEGVFAHCCVKAQPSQIPSQTFIECDNEKMTQTTAEDFKCATDRLKREIQEQKKRQKLYKKAPIQRTESTAIPPYCPRDESEDECEDPKMLNQLEATRDQFFKKRIAMATGIKKSLDKKYGDVIKYGEC